MTKLSALTIKEALTRLKKGLMSAQDLCAKCHQRIQKTKVLNMYVTEVPAEKMSSQANKCQKFIDKGDARPLEAIPIAFKDNFCTAGIATTCSSHMLYNYVPPYDATMVRRCLDNGAILSGKLNLDEFAMGSSSLNSIHGPVRNPWNFVLPPSKPDNNNNNNNCGPKAKIDEPDGGCQTDLVEDDFYIAGGSSGGSAAAVAAGTCLAAFGSDTGGSIRIPASYCGVVGLKPTYGLLSRHGVIPLVNSTDCPGIFTKTVEDCAIVLNTVAGHDAKDSTSVHENFGPINIDPELDLTGLHIGIPKEFYVSCLSEEVVSLWRDMADVLENSGARVSQVSLPHTRHAMHSYTVLAYCEVASNFARYDGIEFGLRRGSEESTEELYAASRHLGFNEEVRGRILSGNYFLLESNYEKYFIKAQQVRRLVLNDVRRVFESGVDLLLTPMALSEAPLVSWYSNEKETARREEMDTCCVTANLTGMPAISIPLRLSQNGLPLGLQLIGQAFGESKLLSVAHWLEQTANCPRLSLDFIDCERESKVL